MVVVFISFFTVLSETGDGSSFSFFVLLFDSVFTFTPASAAAVVFVVVVVPASIGEPSKPSAAFNVEFA